MKQTTAVGNRMCFHEALIGARRNSRSREPFTSRPNANRAVVGDITPAIPTPAARTTVCDVTNTVRRIRVASKGSLPGQPTDVPAPEPLVPPLEHAVVMACADGIGTTKYSDSWSPTKVAPKEKQ